MESPNLPKALALCRRQGLKFDIMATSFFLGRRSVVPSAHSGMPLWQDKLFIYLMKNAANPTEFFKIPPGRVVELGAQVTVLEPASAHRFSPLRFRDNPLGAAKKCRF